MTTGVSARGAASSLSNSSSGRRSQRRAHNFRYNTTTGRAITILEQSGVTRTLQHRGRLNLLSHTSTLNALEKQALRFTNRQLTPNQQDKDLIQSAVSNAPSHQTLTAIENYPFQDEEEVSRILSENQALLQPIGIAPGPKGEGVTRLFYENLNGITASISNNHKLQKAMGIIDDMEVDVFAFNEHKINFAHNENRRQGLAKLFNGGETLTRAAGGNIKHPIAKSLRK